MSSEIAFVDQISKRQPLVLVYVSLHSYDEKRRFASLISQGLSGRLFDSDEQGRFPLVESIIDLTNTPLEILVQRLALSVGIIAC